MALNHHIYTKVYDLQNFKVNLYVTSELTSKSGGYLDISVLILPTHDLCSAEVLNCMYEAYFLILYTQVSWATYVYLLELLEYNREKNVLPPPLKSIHRKQITDDW